MNSEIEYKRDKDGWIHWSSDSESGCFFSTDTTGRWDIYQAWLEAGNTPEPWEPN